MPGVGKVSFELKALEQEGAAQACRTRLIGKDLQIILHQRKMFNQVLNIPIGVSCAGTLHFSHKEQDKTDRPLFEKDCFLAFVFTLLN